MSDPLTAQGSTNVARRCVRELMRSSGGLSIVFEHTNRRRRDQSPFALTSPMTFRFLVGSRR